MDMQTSHLAAALMSGSTAHNNALHEATAAAPNVNEESKTEKPSRTQKDTPEEDKEEMASGEDFSDEVYCQQCILTTVEGRNNVFCSFASNNFLSN